MFAPLRATVPEYAKYLRTLESATGLAVNHKTRVAVYLTVRAEIYDPQDDDNKRSTPQTLEHVKAFAAGMLKTFEGGNAMKYVDDGEFSVQNQIEEMVEAFDNTDRNTNAMEGFWGHIKYIDSLFNAAVHNTNAIVCAQRDELLGDDSARFVVRREERQREEVGASMTKKRERDEVSEGRVDELALDVKAAAFLCARTTGLAAYMSDAHADDAERKAEEAARFEEKKKAALLKQVKSFVAARKAIAETPIIDDATVRGRTGLAALERRLDGYLGACTTPAAKTRALKGTIKRYSVGQGHAALAPKSFTSTVDASVGKEGSPENITFLRDTLVGCWRSIKSERLELSSEPVIPEFHGRVLSTLGTPALWRIRAESESLGTEDEVRSEADAYEAAASARRSSRSSGAGSSARRSSEPPPIDASLLRRRVLVLWNITYTVRGGGNYTDLFSCPGIITDISGEDTEVEGHGKVGMGWIFVEYDDGEKGWIIASRSGFFGTSRAGAWVLVPEGSEEEEQEEEEEEGPDVVDAPDTPGHGDGELSEMDDE